MEGISVAQARRAESIGREVQLHGWVRTRRDSKGGFSFLELNDGSCFGNIQIIAEASLPNYESEVKHLTAGCSISVTGEVRKSPAQGQETEVQARRSWSTAGPIRKPTRCRKSGIRSNSCELWPTSGRAPTRSEPSHGSATAFAARFTTSFKNRAFSTFTRRSSRRAIAKARGRCSRSPRSISPSSRAKARTSPGTSSAGRRT